MKRLYTRLREVLSKKNIKKQLNVIFVAAMLLPMLLIGAFLLFNTYTLLLNYHKDLSRSDHLRTETVLYELTAQLYKVSGEITFDSRLQHFLSGEYDSRQEYLQAALKNDTLDNYKYNYAEIDSVSVYCDSPHIYSYGDIVAVDDGIMQSEWYKKALSQTAVFWQTIVDTDIHGNSYYKLALIRKIPLIDADYDAVLVLKISENYLKSRINTGDYQVVMYDNEERAFFCSERLWYEKEEKLPVDFEDRYFEYQGKTDFEGERYMLTASALGLYQTDSRIYICNLSSTAYDNIFSIMRINLLIIAAAILLPLILKRLFLTYFAERIDILRTAIHNVSTDNYNVPTELKGEDEISQAFSDLQLTIGKIVEKDSRMYEAAINEQRLVTEQQVMEYKMLSSQINPHFLYNTLEAIRMKALANKDREVANAIKLLGKSMRYVLSNTGTVSVSLKQELDYIENYLKIIKFRFVDKINYLIYIAEGMNTSEYSILPLLLQPVIENSIIHGLENCEHGGMIVIKVLQTGEDELSVEIEDNGCGMDEGTLQKLRDKLNTPDLNPSSSIGMYNISQRIRLCYGTKYGLDIESTQGSGTKVTVRLPLR